MKHFRFLFILGCLLVSGCFAQAAIDSDVCMDCHEDTVTAVMKTVHVEANMVSCESCHGSAENHIEDPMIDNIGSFSTMDADAIQQVCGSCHADQQPIKSSHYGIGSACLNCHNAGHADTIANRAMLNDISGELCLDCHKDVRARMNRPYSHPMDDYDNTCIGCHNAHESRTEQMGNRMDETCATCHPGKNGPFMFEHLGGANTGCGECHEPHGSTHPNLLNRHDTRILCLSCHTDTPVFHDQTDLRYRQCTACHSAIQGSNINHLLME